MQISRNQPWLYENYRTLDVGNPDSSIRHARPQPEHFEPRILNRRSSATRGMKTMVLKKKTKSINEREDQYQEDTYGVLFNFKNLILRGGSLVLSFLCFVFFCFFRTSSKSLHWRCSYIIGHNLTCVYVKRHIVSFAHFLQTVVYF